MAVRSCCPGNIFVLSCIFYVIVFQIFLGKQWTVIIMQTPSLINRLETSIKLRLMFEIELQNIHGGPGILLPHCRKSVQEWLHFMPSRHTASGRRHQLPPNTAFWLLESAETAVDVNGSPVWSCGPVGLRNTLFSTNKNAKGSTLVCVTWTRWPVGDSPGLLSTHTMKHAPWVFQLWGIGLVFIVNMLPSRQHKRLPRAHEESRS